MRKKRHQGEGILYPARRIPARHSCALFDRAKGAVQALGPEPLADPEKRTWLAEILDVYGYGLIDESPP